MPNSVSVVKGFTKPITAAYEITSDLRVVAFTLFVVSGTCEILGSDKINGEDSTAITLSAGTPFVMAAGNSGVLDGWTITPIGGTTNLVIQR